MEVPIAKYKSLKFIQFTKLDIWSYAFLVGKKSTYNESFDKIFIGSILEKSKNVINIKDDEFYNRVTVKINCNGVVLRDTEKGVNIGTKMQFKVKAGQFIVSKIDARNGAFGIIPNDLDGAVVTNDFPVYDINSKVILPDFFLLLSSTNEFIKFAKSCSSGTTNRQRMDMDLFMKQEIPLPTLAEQQKIVDAYTTKIQQAQALQTQANNLEEEIEKYFLEQLGIKQFILKDRVFGLQTVDYFNLDRWDFFSTDNSIISGLRKSKYELSTIGKAYDFAKRPFNKNSYKKDTFRYIEIGAIDPNKGILEAKEILTKNAPSRATQFVKQGDLILGTTRPYLKKFAIVSNDYDGDVCSSGFSVIAENDNYYLPFLLQFLKCTYGVEQLKNKMTGGLYPAITEAELKDIKIPLPNREVQVKIMQLIEEKKNNIINNTKLISAIHTDAQQEFEKQIFG